METKPYFGWKYFHFIDPTGPRVNAVVHETDIFGLKSEPYMSMTAKLSNHTSLRNKGGVDYNWNISPNSHDGDFEFKFDNGTLFEGDLVELNLDNGLRDITLFHHQPTDKSSMWSIEVPYGHFSGTLVNNNQEKPLSGYVYQDRQWGNIMLQEWMRDWTWGHYASDNSFTIFFQIATQTGQTVSHAMWEIDNKNSISNSSTLDHFPQLCLPENLTTNDQISGKAILDSRTQLQINLSPESIMRSRLNEKYDNFIASYVRWSSEGLLTNKYIDIKMFGVTEYLRIR